MVGNPNIPRPASHRQGHPPSHPPGRTFGLLLNFGRNLGPTPEAVFDLTRRQARLAEEAGYHDLWITEHHAIEFGINPSATTAAAFLLGLTERVRVGTAVVLSPLAHPADLAERVALLDQFSGGRFDLGLGRGGYLLDYQLLGVDTARWDAEPAATIEALLATWSGEPSAQPSAHSSARPGAVLQPEPFTRPHPPILVGTMSDEALEVAARHGLALQHYFATPPDWRIAVEARYEERRPASDDRPTPAHLHTLIVLVADDEVAARDQLAASLATSFRAGDHPKVPNQPERHPKGPDGKPLDRAVLAKLVAGAAIVGPSAKVVDQLGAFCTATGARRLALYQEAVADPALTLASVERFATEVAPQLTLT